MLDTVGRWTHREFETREAWLEMQWNVPDRHDQYLMSIAAEVRRVLHKNPQSVKIDDFRLRFSKSESPPKRRPPVSEAEKRRITAEAKHRWLRMFPHLYKQKYGDGTGK